MEVKPEEKNIIPDIIVDTSTNTCYKKGRFFGKGGFARCYEITDLKTSSTFAGKIVSKTLMTKHNQRDKMTQEIMIHQSLSHKHVVGFHRFFEDENNIYIVLELCTRRSMMELHKRRKAITEPEARYYMYHLLQGVKYLHDNNIIHRDLKLGNLFLSETMEVKIGDFGLAAKVLRNGERKRTLCGTPNYIAPEILNKVGHSFEVDVWSVGCILFTLLIGKPPFETSSLKETYARIKRCEYRIPSSAGLSTQAIKFIKIMLHPEPHKRPTIKQLLDNDFFTCGFHPQHLTASCLTMAPRLDTLERMISITPKPKGSESRPLFRKPLIEMNGESSPSPAKRSNPRQSMHVAGGRLASRRMDACGRNHVEMLDIQLRELVAKLPKEASTKVYGDESSDPAAAPFIWIAKWVDYSDKYGFGYLLSDDVLGVMFNDTTKLVLLGDGDNVHYINGDGTENYHTMADYPKELDKKMKLLLYFRRYMSEHLVKAGGDAMTRPCDNLSRPPYLYQWFRTESSVVMHLTNGTLQINFMDHTKVIICPLMKAVTWIAGDKSMRTFRFETIVQNGCCPALARALRYSQEKVRSILLN